MEGDPCVVSVSELYAHAFLLRTLLLALDTEQLVAAALCLISLSQFLLSNFASQDTRYRHTKHLLFVLCSICSLVDSMLSLILICCLVNRFPGGVGVGVL